MRSRPVPVPPSSARSVHTEKSVLQAASVWLGSPEQFMYRHTQLIVNSLVSCWCSLLSLLGSAWLPERAGPTAAAAAAAAVLLAATWSVHWPNLSSQQSRFAGQLPARSVQEKKSQAQSAVFAAGFPLKEKNWAGSAVQSAVTASPSSSRGRTGRTAAPPGGRDVGAVAGIADNLVVADLVVAVFDIVCILMFDLVVKGAIVDVVCETVLIDFFVDVMNEMSVKEVVGDEVLMGVTELIDVGLLFVLLVVAAVAVIVSIPAVPGPGRVGGRAPVGLLSISVRLPPVTFPWSSSGLPASGPATVAVAAGLLLAFFVGLVLEVIDGSVSERMNAGISSSEPSDDGLSLVIGFIGCSIIVASPVDSDIIFRIVDFVVVSIVIVSVMVSFILVTFSEVSWPFSPTRSFPAES